jgi:hypothetical protein
MCQLRLVDVANLAEYTLGCRATRLLSLREEAAWVSEAFEKGLKVRLKR